MASQIQLLTSQSLVKTFALDEGSCSCAHVQPGSWLPAISSALQSIFSKNLEWEFLREFLSIKPVSQKAVVLSSPTAPFFLPFSQ